jgi:hypothetical protein
MAFRWVDICDVILGGGRMRPAAFPASSTGAGAAFKVGSRPSGQRLRRLGGGLNSNDRLICKDGGGLQGLVGLPPHPIDPEAGTQLGAEGFHGAPDRLVGGVVGDGEDRVDDREQEQDPDTDACGEGDEDSVGSILEAVVLKSAWRPGALTRRKERGGFEDFSFRFEVTEEHGSGIWDLETGNSFSTAWGHTAFNQGLDNDGSLLALM